MRRDRPHTHPCQRCGVLTECHGDLEPNPDGWPEVICVDFDTRWHGDFRCEDCAEIVARLAAADLAENV